MSKQPVFFSGPVDTPIRAAATVVVLRDGEPGLEVLMLRRNVRSAVLGGAYVFPGGKLDPADRSIAHSGRLGSPVERLHARLGEPALDADVAAALYVAACRETLEEAGVLFAHGADARVAEHARELACGERGFEGMLDDLGLELNTGRMMPWSRWITPRTPSMMDRRFDARFFVAALPAGQQAKHDEHEATESIWLRPAAALERYRNRDIVLAPVQLMSLAHLARHRSVDSVLDEAQARTPPLIEPEPYEDEAGRAIAYPGDPRHPVRTRALPGPTSLRLREDRFEPPDGFDEWLS